MSNVLQPNVPQPTAPGYDELLYPQLPPDFRLQKINEVSAALNNEVSHYRKVRKKYKKARNLVNWRLPAPAFFRRRFRALALARLFQIVGLPATIPLGGTGGGFALPSTGLIVARKRLDSKIKKHQENVIAIEIPLIKWCPKCLLIDKFLMQNFSQL